MPIFAVTIVTYGFSPAATDVGYMPTQPVPYSHAVHAGKLGMDCRYCHTTVETAAHAAVPPTQTCMGCHTALRADSPRLEAVRQSFATGLPVNWVRVHDLADFVYFNHSAHVSRGVGCVSCHGRVDRMEVVYQKQPLSMAWCLECHRNPEPHLRPVEFVTKMDFDASADLGLTQAELGAKLRRELNINPSVDCSTCHR
ncbi:MAG: cytochrome c3 family protein [Phycisphaerae bacterium]